MHSARWNEIIDNAAGEALDSFGDQVPTLQDLANRAATLAAEAVAEALAEEEGVADAEE